MSAKTEKMSDMLAEVLVTFLRENRFDPSDATLAAVARALDAALIEEAAKGGRKVVFPKDAEHAHTAYRSFYDGDDHGKAEDRQVIVPEWAEKRSLSCLHRVARIEREHDDIDIATLRWETT